MSFENRLVKSDIYLFHICMESAVWMRGDTCDCVCSITFAEPKQILKIDKNSLFFLPV